MKKNIFHSTNNPKNCICENPFNSQNKNLSVNIISHNNQAGITGPTGPTGPTGATGATGGEVVVRSTTTMDPNKQASVVSTLDGNKTMLDFFIPKGETGPCAVIKSGNAESIDSDKNPEVIVRNENNEYYLDFKIPRGQAGSKGDKGDKGEKGATGEKGAQGDRGLKGDKGEKGDAGIGETIIVEDTETLEPEDEAFVIDDFSNGTHHLTFQIPRGATGTKGDTGEKGEQGEQGIQGPQGAKGETGDTGPMGPTGVAIIPMGLILSYNNDPNTFPAEGIQVASNGRLPLMRLELDNEGILELDTTENTIKFVRTGVYKITFTVNGYVKKTDTDFNPAEDFSAVVFREADTEKILAAANSWSFNEEPVSMFGEGAFVVDNTDKLYELVNVQRKTMYVYGADIMKTTSQSYFSVPMVSILITQIK